MAPPQNVTAVNKTTNSIFITWDAILANQGHREILGYKVTYSLTKTRKPGIIGIKARVVSVPTVHVNLTGLRASKKYNITVLAYSQCGNGPRSKILVEKTDEDSKF